MFLIISPMLVERVIKPLISPAVFSLILQPETKGKDSLTGLAGPRIVTVFLFHADFLPCTI